MPSSKDVAGLEEGNKKFPETKVALAAGLDFKVISIDYETTHSPSRDGRWSQHFQLGMNNTSRNIDNETCLKYIGSRLKMTEKHSKTIGIC